MIEDIKSPNDIKKISLQELESLAAEIREMIIKTVSMNGGHLQIWASWRLPLLYIKCLMHQKIK
jgi:hypothetical protein